MSSKKKLIRQITKNLYVWRFIVEDDNKRGRTDINQEAEYLVCDLLNLLKDWNLKNQNTKDSNHPAIDLGDQERGICVQVTSNSRREKIAKTLKLFESTGLMDTYLRLIFVIIGERRNYEKSFGNIQDFDFDPDRDIWDIHRLVSEVSSVEDTSKLEEIDLCLRKHLRDAMILHLPMRTSLGIDGFVGRAHELEQMTQALRNGVKPLILTGLGGIGKTELANHFGRRYQNGKVYHAVFRGSFRNTVVQSLAAGIPGLLDENRPEQEVYNLVMERLRECGDSDILIIDNVDRKNEPFEALQDHAYRDLCALDMHLILTTRLRCSGALEVGPLEQHELREIFVRHNVELSNADKDTLIRAVDGHTMTVDLIARILYESWGRTQVKSILDAILNSKLRDSDFPAVYADYDRSADRKQQQIYAHLRALFNLTDITSAERCAMCCAALLPTEGLGGSFFLEALPDYAQHTVDRLVKRGWLRRKGNLLAIHPVVRVVCIEELHPTDEDCEEFLTNIFEKYCDSKQDDPELMVRMAQLFGGVRQILPNDQALWSLQASNYWTRLGEYDTALEFQQRILDDWKDDPGVEDYMWATVYNSLAITYMSIGRYEEAKNTIEKALSLMRSSDDSSLIAKIYENLTLIYIQSHEFERAQSALVDLTRLYDTTLHTTDRAWMLSYLGGMLDLQAIHYQAGLNKMLKAAGMLEQNPSADPWEYAQVCSDITMAAITQNEFQLGEHYNNKALSIRKRILNDNHPLLGETYLYRAWLLLNTGDLEESMRCSQNAVRILQNSTIQGNILLTYAYICRGANLGISLKYKQALQDLELAYERLTQDPYTSPQWTATCLTYMGIAHVVLKSVEQGLDELHHAYQIWETHSTQAGPEIIQTYNTISTVLLAAGDLQQALDFCQKTLELHNQKGGKEPLALGETYFIMLQIYDLMDDSDDKYEDLMEISKDAIRIMKAYLPDNHFNFALTYHILGKACMNTHRTTQALYYLRMAQDICDQSYGGDNPITMVNRVLLALQYLMMSDYRSAQRHLQQVLLSNNLGETQALIEEMNLWDIASTVDMCVMMQDSGEEFDNPFLTDDSE